MRKPALLTIRDEARPQLFMITVPGLSVKADWRVVHDRLLDDFPRVCDVLPTTQEATLLIVYEGQAEIDPWLDEVGEAVLSRREGFTPRGVLSTTERSWPRR